MTDKKPTGERALRPSKPLLLHPLVLFTAVWGSIIFLYFLHLSGLLIFSNAQVLHAVTWIYVPFLIAVSLSASVRFLAPGKSESSSSSSPIPIQRLHRRLLHWFFFWSLATIVEIMVSGGLPLLWLLRGSSKTYLDFGIPSIHGLLNSLILTVGLGEFALFVITGAKRHLWIPAWLMVWPVIVVTRNMMIVFLIEAAVLWVYVKGIRWQTLLKLVLSAMLVVLVFGYIGDLRSGAAAFRKLALPSKSYPDWLPSGVLWVYIYMTTPLGNLINTSQLSSPLHSFLFPNTTSLLFPSVLRDIIYGGAAQASVAFGGNLVSQAFNVSTAFIGPFQDFGWPGVAGLSIVLGLISEFCWHKRGMKGALVYAVIAQCVILTLFFNHLFYLPVITQVVWIILFFRKSPKQVNSDATEASL